MLINPFVQPVPVSFCTASQRLAAVQTCDALKQCLESIPNLQSTDNQLQALSTFGSLQQLSQSSVDDIVAYTGCSDEQAEALWEFWNMG